MNAQTMWKMFKNISGLETDKYDAWQFGDDPDMLAQLVLKGRKTATASAWPLYQLENEPLPEEGQYSVILNSDDEAVCIIRNTRVTVIPYSDISADHARKEGEGDLSLAYWRKVHEAFFTAELKSAGLVFDESMPVVCEEFEMVYPRGETRMKITDTFAQIPSLFENGVFSMGRWNEYAQAIHPELPKLCRDDVRECLSTGQYTWESNYLPVLNAVIADDDKREAAHTSFLTAVNGLEERITAAFGRAPEIEIIFYAGLCCGAGWVTELGGKTVILLGLEKIMELNWHGLNAMLGLIYHELGHVYQAQFGTLERKFDTSRESFLWQLFTEGIAMVFEQEASGQPDVFHQYDANWKDWCDAHFSEIVRDFNADLPTMSFAAQRWFGDWVSYRGRGDVGYYLGCRFVRFILKTHSFDEILSFEIDQVEAEYEKFIAE